jgi:hypothetical protein
VANDVKHHDGPEINLMCGSSGTVGNDAKWKKPTFTVTDFDSDDDDYAADSDDCSV